MDEHSHGFWQIWIFDLPAIQKAEDDQKDQKHQFPMQPTLSLSCKKPLS